MTREKSWPHTLWPPTRRPEANACDHATQNTISARVANDQSRCLQTLKPLQLAPPPSAPSAPLISRFDGHSADIFSTLPDVNKRRCAPTLAACPYNEISAKNRRTSGDGGSQTDAKAGGARKVRNLPYTTKTRILCVHIEAAADGRSNSFRSVLRSKCCRLSTAYNRKDDSSSSRLRRALRRQSTPHFRHSNEKTTSKQLVL